MPHFIIEYARPLLNDEAVQPLLTTIHNAACQTALFDETHIKSRAIAYDHYRQGNQQTHFIHATLKIHIGRTQAQKSLLSKCILDAIKNHCPQAHIITVEVVDMDKPTYAKYSQEP